MRRDAVAAGFALGAVTWLVAIQYVGLFIGTAVAIATGVVMAIVAERRP